MDSGGATNPMSNAEIGSKPASKTASSTNLRTLGVVLLNYSHVITFFALVIAASIASPHFLNSTNILNVVRGASMVGVVAIGMTVVILSRGIDLSAGSLVGVAAISAAALAGHGSAVAWIAALALTTFLGAINGVLITKLRLQPFIATLAMMIFARGCVYLYSDGGDTYAEGADAAFRWLGSGYIWIIPVPVVLFVALWLALAYVMKHTRWGRHVYAVGANRGRCPRIWNQCRSHQDSSLFAGRPSLRHSRIAAGQPR